MRRRVGLRMAAFVLVAMCSAATGAADFSPRTGDREIDLQLAEINAIAAVVPDGVIGELVATYGAPRYLVRELLEQRQWAAGDVFFACALAYRMRRPCADVAREYQEQPAPGWSGLARSLGVRPGSASLLALKGQLAKSAKRLKAQMPGTEPPADAEAVVDPREPAN